MSELWSCPIIVSLFFCTQVIIANIIVIHYELRDCIDSKTCDFWLRRAFTTLLLSKSGWSPRVKAQKEGAQIPPHPSYDEILMMASSILGGKNGNSNN